MARIVYKNSKVEVLRKDDFKDESLWDYILEHLGFYTDDDRDQLTICIASAELE